MLSLGVRINRGVRLREIASLGSLLDGPGCPSEEEAADRFISRIDALVRQIGIPSRLSQVGVSREQIPALVKGARGNSMDGNPRNISDAELAGLSSSAVGWDKLRVPVLHGWRAPAHFLRPRGAMVGRHRFASLSHPTLPGACSASGPRPKRGHQAAEFLGRIEAEGVFAVLEKLVGRELVADVDEFRRCGLLLVGGESLQLPVEFVNPLESLEV